VVVLAGFGALHAKPDKQNGTSSPNYYPLQVGNQWTYKVSVGDNSAVTVSRVAKMETFNGGPELARLEASISNNVVATEHLRQTDQGVFRYRNNGVEVMPPICLLKYPVAIKPKEPMKWSNAVKAGAEKGTTYSAEAVEESVEVPLGKFQAIRVEIKQGKGADTTYWFVKDIGFVKQTVKAGDLSILMELEKFDRAKGSAK
jgi:hypothetical protein